MTRFARAHGSKGANERLPEDATPWTVLRNQMLDSQEGQSSRPEDLDGTAYNNEDEEDENQMNLKIQNIACSLKKKTPVSKVKKYETQYVADLETPSAMLKKNQDSVPESFSENKGKSKKKKISSVTESLEGDSVSELFIEKKGKSKKKKNISNVTETPSEVDSVSESFIEKKGKSKKNISNVTETPSQVDSVSESFSGKKGKSKKKIVKVSNDTETSLEVDTSVQNLQKPIKKKKKARIVEDFYRESYMDIEMDEEKIVSDKTHNKNKSDLLQNTSEGEIPDQKSSKKKRNHQDANPQEILDNKPFKKRKVKQDMNSSNKDEIKNNEYESEEVSNSKPKKNGKKHGKFKEQIPDKKEPVVFFMDKHKEIMKQKKLNKTPFTTVLPDGRELSLMKFDGFDVLKDDAERLNVLRKKLRSSGIPGEKIKEVMQLERRRAEKALQREKKKVCFHCRQPGHVMQDCPQYSNEQEGQGICFKCGSTEHRSYDCRVNRTDTFRFAKCFICGGEGHIARQCSDNPRGLYPQGGGCYMCGDVTHLKKDCPALADSRAENKITVHRFSGSTRVEALDDSQKHNNSKEGGTQKKKIVKF